MIYIQEAELAGLMTAYHNYLITSLDLHLVNLQVSRGRGMHSFFQINVHILKNQYPSDIKEKELSFGHKLKSSDSNIFATLWCKPLIFQTQILLSISINSLKYLRSTALGYKDIEIRKSECVAKTQLLYSEFQRTPKCTKREY